MPSRSTKPHCGLRPTVVQRLEFGGQRGALLAAGAVVGSRRPLVGEGQAVVRQRLAPPADDDRLGLGAGRASLRDDVADPRLQRRRRLVGGDRRGRRSGLGAGRHGQDGERDQQRGRSRLCHGPRLSAPERPRSRKG